MCEVRRVVWTVRVMRVVESVPAAVEAVLVAVEAVPEAGVVQEALVVRMVGAPRVMCVGWVARVGLAVRAVCPARAR